MRAAGPLLLLLLASCLAGAGCAHRSEPPPTLAVHREAGAGAPAVAVTLPASGLTLALTPRPLLTETDLRGLEVVEGLLGPALRLRLAPGAAAELVRQERHLRGRRLVLRVDGQAVAAARWEGAEPAGFLTLHLEVPPATALAWAARWRAARAGAE